ncbi:MAG: DISARM system phospholipase D-like protein DrmC [Synechococcaceae cyanobacterium]
MAAVFPHLSTAELETLLASLDPHQGNAQFLAESLADPPAFLARIGLQAGPQSLAAWLESWRSAGGSQESLLMTVQALLDQRRREAAARSIELVWSGPDPGAGSVTRDQSVLIRQLVERAEQRLLLTTYAVYKGPFINELFQLIRERMVALPTLQVRMICNLHRDRGDTSSPGALIRKFQQQTWSRLWPQPPAPALFFDPRSLSLEREKAVCHVKAVVADEELLVTSANLTDAAQLSNFELGLHLGSSAHADDVWDHFDRLIQQGLLQSVQL